MSVKKEKNLIKKTPLCKCSTVLEKEDFNEACSLIRKGVTRKIQGLFGVRHFLKYLTILKVFFELLQDYFCFMFVFFFLVFWLWGMWDLRSLARDWIHTLCIGKEVLTTGPLGEDPICLLFISTATWESGDTNYMLQKEICGGSVICSRSQIWIPYIRSPKSP